MKSFLTLLLCLILRNAFTQTYVFAQLQGAPVNTAGWNFQGDATVGNVLGNNSSEIILCSRGSNKSGAVFCNQPINLSICKKWKAEFDFRIYDGSGADGIAFCFLDVPPVGFVTGQGLGIPATANGLKIGFDTYNNCTYPYTLNMPKVEIRWGVGYNECWSQPTADNATGNLSFIRSATYNHALIEYIDGVINVSVNGQLLLTGNQQFNFSGYLGFTASIGGFDDNHSIKNVIIYTDMPPSVAGGVNGVASICSNSSLQLGTSSNSSYVYSWSPSIGLSNTTIANPVLQYNNTTDSIITSTYYVKTAFASNPGCYSSDSVAITIKPKAKINFGIPGICLNDAIANFTDSSSTRDKTSLPFTYAWNFGDASSTPANLNTSSQKNPAHIYKAANVYSVKSVVTTAFGCVDSLIKTLTVNGSVPKADFVFTSNQTICSGDSMRITDNSSVDFGNLTRVDIFWDVTNNPTTAETHLNPSFNQRYTHAYSSFLSPSAKTISIRYDVYSGITCVNSITKSFQLLAAPKIFFAAIPSICDNDSAYQINQVLEKSGMQGVGIFSGAGVNNNGLFKPFMYGTYPIQYAFTAANGCKDSAMQTITVWQSPTIHAGPDLLVLEGKSALIQASSSSDHLQYIWTPSTYLDNNTLLQPTTTPLQNIVYSVLATDSNGCKNKDSVAVKVLLKPIAPNAFTPNGDGINDTWMIANLKDYPDCVVQVFNRSGQLVFQSIGYNTPWDGTFKGSPLPIGTYYYVIQPKSGRETQSGSVTIIR